MAFTSSPKSPRTLPLLATAALLAAGLGACANPRPPAAQLGLTTAPAPVSAPVPMSSVSMGTCGFPRFEQDLLRRVNEFRAAAQSCGARGRFAAAGPLRWSGALARLASTHAQHMVARNHVEHEDASGRGPAQRATQAGYAWSVFAENVAGNYPGTAQVVLGWQKSPGHCANLMDPAVTEMGVACASGTARSEFQTYWAMELAKPR